VIPDITRPRAFVIREGERMLVVRERIDDAIAGVVGTIRTQRD
jgi:hypothetical protein